MEWQAVVLVIQILLLTVGWFLFQQARGELSARAAETPVLGEVKALQRNVKQLLQDLERTSERASGNLEAKCAEARTLATQIDTLLTLQDNLLQDLSSQAMGSAQAVALISHAPAAPPLVLSQPAPSHRTGRRESVYQLADNGQEASQIARETGLSEGEVETMLGLRPQRA